MIMKPFAHYLAESTKTFDYRIKICGDYDAGCMKDFKEQLKKFDIASMSDPKTTPVIAKPSDFPDQVNQRVTMLDVKFRYPATPQQIEQVAKLSGLDPNCVCMHQLDWAEGMDTELLGLDDQKDLLTSDYPADSKEQKKLSKEDDHAPDDLEHLRFMEEQLHLAILQRIPRQPWEKNN